MLAVILVVVIVWAAWLRKEHPDYINVPTLIVNCVSVAVAFIPEGLPIAITAGLTITANMMRKHKVLCKSLKTVETLGSVSVICSDKTGTLTAGQDVPDRLLRRRRQHDGRAAQHVQRRHRHGCAALRRVAGREQHGVPAVVLDQGLRAGL